MAEDVGRYMPASRNIDHESRWDRIAALVLRPTAPPLGWGIATAIVFIAAEVAVVHLLKQLAPEDAFGAVFLLGVLVVSARWGFGLAVATSVASTVAYAWFHASEGTESTGPAVVVFLVLALLTNLLVGQSRLRALESDQRRREADLSAALARTVLRAADLPQALTAAGARLTDVLELPPPGAAITTDQEPGTSAQRRIALRDDDRPVGSLLVPADLPAADLLRVQRMVPGLEALLAAAQDRDVLYERTVALGRQQAALRRVATLVASRTKPEDVYAAVADELADELGVEHVSVIGFSGDGYCLVLAARDGDDADRSGAGLTVGERLRLGGNNISTRILASGDLEVTDYAEATGPIAARLHARGIGSGVGVPITVEGRTWGAIVIGTRERAAIADIRVRLNDFAELVATAVYNDESRSALTRSRARVIAAADQARRAIERDLHDGAQQRIVSLGLELRSAQAMIPDNRPDLRNRLDDIVDSLSLVHTDLQELSRGIHPAILSRGGLGPALKTLARRSAVPVSLTVRIDGRLPDAVEVAAYYVVAEALTNTAKYAGASGVEVTAIVDDQTLDLTVADDGSGNAHPDNGSGLVGLRDRIEAVNGVFTVSSPPGVGTTLTALIPVPERVQTTTTG